MKGLALKHISKSFGKVRVLKDVSLKFAPGEVTAIVGDNGAGKSTLLKIIAGIHAPDRGRIMLDGERLTSRDAFLRRGHGIEMVYQDLALAKQQDVVANLFLGREMSWLGFLHRKGMARQAAQELKRLGIRISRLDQPVGLLSGGQQQAVAIARAVLFDPKVLLLDEPTASLAAREVRHVLKLIRTEKERGRIVVLVSHRLNDVFDVADRIVVMKQGEIAANKAADKTSLDEIVELIVE
jgi:simple sugar transport system ATP-binding protein